MNFWQIPPDPPPPASERSTTVEGQKRSFWSLILSPASSLRSSSSLLKGKGGRGRRRQNESQIGTLLLLSGAHKPKYCPGRGGEEPDSQFHCSYMSLSLYDITTVTPSMRQEEV